MDGNSKEAAIARLRGKANKVHNILAEHNITMEEATAFSAQIFMMLEVMGQKQPETIRIFAIAAMKVSSDAELSSTPLVKIKE